MLSNENTLSRTVFENTYASVIKEFLKDIIQKVSSVDLKIKANVFTESNQYSILNLKLDLDPIADQVFTLKYYVDAKASLPSHKFLSLLYESYPQANDAGFNIPTFLFSQVPFEFYLQIIVPYLKYIKEWVSFGALCLSPEFFVLRKDPHNNFEMDTSKVPDFISPNLAQDIFVTGALRNLLTQISGEGIHPREDNQVYTLESLPLTVDSYHVFYSRTVADLYHSKYLLRAHFFALTEFILLRNDAFASALLESLLYPTDFIYF